jgi:hypothetical protein
VAQGEVWQGTTYLANRNSLFLSSILTQAANGDADEFLL